MLLFLRKLHHYWLLLCMGALFCLFYPMVYYFSLKSTTYLWMIKLRRFWAFLSSLLAGIVYRFEFEEPVDWSKTYVICANHTSNLDTAMICVLMRKDNFCFMGKSELLDDMITGIYFRTVDIPVNRHHKISAFRAFKAAGQKLDQGIHMIMFPEGGIADEYPPHLQEFKSGPFRLAIEQGVQVLPISTQNWKVLWDTGARYGSRPGVCRVQVHKPVDTIGLGIADADALRDKVWGMIAEGIEKKESPLLL